MSTLLLRNATVVVTMDKRRREIADGAVLVRDNVIEAVGRSADLPSEADRVISVDGRLVLPGLVNTHHHLYQTLTRCLPETQDAPLFSWLETLYPIWAKLTPEAVHVSALVGLAELARTGCTTTLDQLYLFPNGVTLPLTGFMATGAKWHGRSGGVLPMKFLT